MPTVGGEIYFESSYEQNCLVNAMCLGLAPHERLIRAAAAGPGNVLVLLGALTGRDGIGGASVLASAELGEGDEAKRPSVQIGDPFAEKKLLECCLELLDRELLVSLQDLGAAGLTSSSSEMASKGGVGLDIDCARVPLREAGHGAVRDHGLRVPGADAVRRRARARRRCDRRLRALGDAGDADRPGHRLGGRLRILLARRGRRRDLPSRCSSTTARCTTSIQSQPVAPLYAPPPAVLRGGESPAADAPRAARVRPTSPRACPCSSSTTRSSSRGPCAAPTRPTPPCWPLPTGEAIAVSIDGNGRRVACDPRRGAAEAVYECAANLACVGAEPLGLTNCLNFGNPEKPHVAWQLTEAVDGIAQACRALDVPVVGGNVSLYNEAPSGPIFPTPVIGMVGRLPDPARAGRRRSPRRAT